jgi:hypothetical protein
MTLIKRLLTLFLLLPALSHALPPEFSASYTAESYGVSIAKAIYKLEHKNNIISFTQHSVPVGLAALFSDDELNETSYLSLHNSRLLLDEYRYVQKGKKDRNIHLKIKWEDSTNNELSGTISGVAGKEAVQLEVNTPVWDTLSFQIPVMMDTIKKTNPQEYTILVKGELKTYTFVTHGPEEIDINDTTIKTIKIERKGSNKKKPLFLWIAPSLHNLPVKIEKWKKGKPHITMLLNDASFPSDKNLKFREEEDFDN